MKLNDLVTTAHEMAQSKGWWNSPREDGTLLMLMVCELAEAAEEARNNTPDVYFKDDGKPEGKAIELVDTIIRIADYFGHKGWNLEELVKLKLEYNKTRSQRHGGKTF